MAQVISKEQAVIEIEKWLDYKQVSDKRRVDNKAQIENLVSAIESGKLILDDDNNLVYNLNFALGKNEEVKQLTFKPRLTLNDKLIHLKNVSPSDFDGRLAGIAKALTGVNGALLNQIDSEDEQILRDISLFFI